MLLACNVFAFLLQHLEDLARPSDNTSVRGTVFIDFIPTVENFLRDHLLILPDPPKLICVQ